LTDRYALFGNPVAHSLSPKIHGLFAEQFNQDISYDKILIEPGEFARSADAFFSSDGKGLNVTAPMKTDAYEYAHQRTERAHLAGAVNVLALLEDGTVLGDNTDGFGLLADLTEHLGWGVQGREILILGAGGTVRGVLGPLMKASPKSITLVNRTYDKAKALAKEFAPLGDIEVCKIDQLKPHRFDLVINGTSAGIAKGYNLDLPDTLFFADAKSYDLNYSMEPTPFRLWSGPYVSEAADGLGMLVAQAAESFRIWRGDFPDFIPVIDKIRTIPPRII